MLIGYFDGSCVPVNPGGIMGIGALICENTTKLWELSFKIPAAPDNTNNIAEYLAVINLLEYLISEDLTQKEILIRGDSMLVVSQMNLKWRIKHGLYTKYAYKAKDLLNEFKNLKFEWIPREENNEADLLSNLDRIEFKPW